MKSGLVASLALFVLAFASTWISTAAFFASPSASTVVGLFPVLLSLQTLIPVAGFIGPQNGRHRFRKPSMSRSAMRKETSRLYYESEGKSMFDTFRVEMDRRQLLSRVKVFQSLNEGDIARLSIVATPIDVNAGDDVFQQGDEANEAYVVLSGAFECYDKADGAVYGTCKPGSLFGELGIFENQKRALSVRASPLSDGALLRLSKEDLSLAFPSSATVVESVLEAEYSDYFEGKKKARALKKCPLFRKLSETDFRRMQDAMDLKSYSKNETVFLQGEEGDSMYFVRSGTFGCLDDKTGNMVATIEEGGFFGELSILLDQNRALSVQALTDGEAYCLSKEVFIECVQESALFESSLASIKESYGLTTIWDAVSALSLEELYNRAIIVSRPVKSRVSKHSTLSTVATGFYLAALLQMLSPGFYANGLPRLYDQMLFNNVELTRITTFLFALIGVTGVFRLPPKSPKLRRLLFEQAAWLSLFAWMTQDSNLNIATGAYTFDYTQTVPAIAYIAVVTMVLVNNMETIVEAISGTIKGRQTLLLSSKHSRIMETMGQILVFVGFVFAFPMAFLVRDSSVLDSTYLPGIAAADGVFLTTNLALSGFLGYGMLICTLVMEKKLTHQKALLVFLADFFVSGMYDTVVPLFDAEIYNIKPEMMQPYRDTIDFVVNKSHEFHVAEVGAALVGTSIAIGLFKLSSEQEGMKKARAKTVHLRHTDRLHLPESTIPTGVLLAWVSRFRQLSVSPIAINAILLIIALS